MDAERMSRFYLHYVLIINFDAFGFMKFTFVYGFVD